MERSEPSDAWDDAGDDAGDAAPYGPAPLPAHERTWRHPSEVGQATWVLTEPPVAIGRGLLVTTGAIGCVLGIAVLWLLMPIGGGLAPSASPTATSSFVTLAPPDAAVDEPTRTDLRSDTTVAISGSPVTLPSEEPPVNTVLVSQHATPDTDGIAVAVALGDHTPFMVTTLNAVGDAEAFSIIGTGDPTDGNVLSIDGDLAFLQSPDGLDVVGFAETGSAEVGDMLVVLGQEQTEVEFVGEGAVTELDATVIREGTPVIDESGALVALCTLVQGSDGSYVALVPIGSPPADPVTTEPASTDPVDSSSTTSSTQPDSTTTTTPTAWAGVRFGDVAGTATPIVSSVITDSPAAAAGVHAGDQIVAVDGVRVTQVDAVLAALKAKLPGDTIVLTVITPVPADPTSTSSTVVPVERSISVVLGVYEPAV